MFNEGNLLLFDPFIFEDGRSQQKFFVVLKNIDGISLLATLPTSKDHIPADLEIHAGCYEHPERGVNIYVFLAEEPVAINEENGNEYHFPKNTFIYGANLNTFPSTQFIEQQLNGATQVHVKGKIKQEIYDDLVGCLKNSKLVKRKYKRML